MKPGKIVLSIFLLSGLGLTGLYAQDSIIPTGSVVIKLSSDQYQFLEGPVWYNDSILVFVDDGMFGMAPDFFQYDPVANHLSIWPSNAPHCTGLTCDRVGNLIGCSSTIIQMNKARQVNKTLALGYNGKPFDNPNDLIADAKGGVYFSDPDFFLTSPPQDRTAVYYIDSTGNVKRVIDDIAEPNGLVLSPDGTKLYVDDGGSNYVYSWNVASDGTVSGKSNLAELQTTVGNPAGADGMAVDIKGNIYVATAVGVQVFSPLGALLSIIVLPEIPSNCDFGGRDFKTLYITAHRSDLLFSNLYSIDLNYAGYAVSRKGFPNAVNSIPNDPSVKIFPNPAGDFLYVQNVPGNVVSLEVLNTKGEKEHALPNMKQESELRIDTRNYQPGIYLLRMVYNGGIVMRKFVKD